MIRKYGLWVAAAAIAACSSEDSASVSTKSITANFRAEVDETTNKTAFSAHFLDGLSDIVLTAGDKAQFTTDKDPTPLDLPRGDLKFYELDLPATDRTTVTFFLIRASGTSAKNNTVAIPASMAITAPAANATIAYGGGTANIDLAWSNAIANGNKVHVAPHDCNAAASVSTGFDIDDSGTATFTTSQVTVAPPTAPQCVKLYLSRSITNGTQDPAFDSGGLTQSSRSQTFQITITP